MPFDAEDLAVFFDADMPGHVLAEISGTPFDALLRGADKDVFGDVRIGTHRLRYLQTVSLAPNDTITIATGLHAGTYTVHGLPQRINAAEFSAELVKQ